MLMELREVTAYANANNEILYNITTPYRSTRNPILYLSQSIAFPVKASANSCCRGMRVTSKLEYPRSTFILLTPQRNPPDLHAPHPLTRSNTQVFLNPLAQVFRDRCEVQRLRFSSKLLPRVGYIVSSTVMPLGIEAPTLTRELFLKVERNFSFLQIYHGVGQIKKILQGNVDLQSVIASVTYILHTVEKGAGF